MADAKPLVIGVGTRCKRFGKENRGNFVHASAAHRILGENTVFPTNRAWNDEQIEKAAEHTHIVLIMANAVRLGTTIAPFTWHKIASENIERTNLPTVVLGLGAQSGADDVDNDIIPSETLRLLEVLKDRSKEIAVRGSFTAECLRSFGIDNVLPLGCQSAIWHGKSFPFSFREGSGQEVLFNYTHARPEARLVEWAVNNGFTMVGQTELWEEHAAAGLTYDSDKASTLFASTDLSEDGYREYCKHHFASFLTAEGWLQRIRGSRISFGTRFHGNMAAVQAGVPALWFTHDSRTKELCEQMHLPHLDVQSAVESRDLDQFLAAADMSGFIENYDDIYSGFSRYLDRAGLSIAV